MNHDNIFFGSLVLIFLSCLFFTLFFFLRIRLRKKALSLKAILLGNVFISLTLIFLSFFLFECYYRFAYDETTGNNMSRVSKRWFERHWHTNAMGVRDNVEYIEKRDKRKIRITFLGDSFTAGHGVPNVEDRFVNRIRKFNNGWEVHGLAEIGLSSQDHLNLLQEMKRVGYELDKVVLVYCYNDIEPFVPELPDLLKKVKSQPPVFFKWFIDHSFFINTFYHNLKRREAAGKGEGHTYFSLMTSAYSGKPWEKQKKTLSGIKALVEESGGTLSVVTFPLLMNLRKIDGSTLKMHQQLNKFWKELGVPHLDLLKVFSNEDPKKLVVNKYDDHPSSYAHEKAALEIYKFLY